MLFALDHPSSVNPNLRPSIARLHWISGVHEGDGHNLGSYCICEGAHNWHMENNLTNNSYGATNSRIQSILHFFIGKTFEIWAFFLSSFF